MGGSNSGDSLGITDPLVVLRQPIRHVMPILSSTVKNFGCFYERSLSNKQLLRLLSYLEVI